VREGFLAQPFFIAEAAKVSTEALAYVHGCLEARLSPIDLQTMRDNSVDCAGTWSMVPSLIVDRKICMAQNVTGLTPSMWRMTAMPGVPHHAAPFLSSAAPSALPTKVRSSGPRSDAIPDLMQVNRA
jgi:hypothetical protein